MEYVTIFKCKQWTCQVQMPEGTKLNLPEVPEVTSYKLVNLGTVGEVEIERYYRAESGQYGQPLLRQEPSLGLDIPKHLVVREKAVGGNWEMAPVMLVADKLVGIIVRDENGKVVERASLTNLANKGGKFNFEPDGSFNLNGAKLWLEVLHSPDKNRLIGLVGYFSAKKPSCVKHLEMEDLVF